MSFGDNLKKLREKAGLSQAALGEKMGLKGSAIGRYELGEATPKPDRILDFAYALETTPNELLSFKEISDLDYAKKYLSNIIIEKDSVIYKIGKTETKIPISKFLECVKEARKETEEMYSKLIDEILSEKATRFEFNFQEEILDYLIGKEYK